MKPTNDKLKNSLINYGIIIFCGLAIMLIIGYSFAWLTDVINKSGSGTIGEVVIEIYDGTTKINGTISNDGKYIDGNPYEITLGAIGTATNLQLNVKNAGNINGIVRCLLTVSTIEGPKDHETDLDGAQYLVTETQATILHPDWVSLYDNEHIEGIYFYNIFLNNVIAPNTTANVITTITPHGDLANTKVYVKIRADIVAYSGNAYQIDSADNPTDNKDKPFGNLSTEFLNLWTAWK